MRGWEARHVDGVDEASMTRLSSAAPSRSHDAARPAHAHTGPGPAAGRPDLPLVSRIGSAAHVAGGADEDVDESTSRTAPITAETLPLSEIRGLWEVRADVELSSMRDAMLAALRVTELCAVGSQGPLRCGTDPPD